MDLLIKGLLLGITLAIMVGPILFTIVQTALERGARAGLSVAAGIWFSDFLYIALIFFAFKYVNEVIAFENFRTVAGIGGGAALVLFGLAMIYFRSHINRPKPTALRSTDYIGLFMKGFIINTLNPFTVFFWIALMTTWVGAQEYTFKMALPFLSGLMGVIVVTDVLKVLFAKTVSKYLKARYIRMFRKISGLALIGFGIFLIVSVTLYPQLLNS